MHKSMSHFRHEFRIIPISIVILYLIFTLYVWDSNLISNSLDTEVNGLSATSLQSFFRIDGTLSLEPRISIQSEVSFPRQFGSKVWIVICNLWPSFTLIRLEQNLYRGGVKVRFPMVSTNPDSGMSLISKFELPQPAYEKVTNHTTYNFRSPIILRHINN